MANGREIASIFADIRIDPDSVAAARAKVEAAFEAPFVVKVVADTTGADKAVKQAEKTQKAITAAQARQEARQTANVATETAKRETIEKKSVAASNLLREKAAIKEAQRQDIAVRQAEKFRLQDRNNLNSHLRQVERMQLRADAAFAKSNFASRLKTSLDKASGSLREFDQTTSRFLRTSLRAFTIWSVGVSAAIATVATVGVASFAKLELAATQAGAAVASARTTDELNRTGKAISDFATVTEDSANKIIAKSQQVALTTLFNPTQISQGIGSLIKSGQDLGQAFQSIGPAANFAQVNMIEVEDAADRVAAALASSGTSAEGASLLIDKISFTAQSALGDASDYLQAFANGAAAAGKSFGYSTDEVLTLLSLIGNAGTTGLEAGTQARIVLRELGRAAGRAGDAWKKYGIDANAPLNEQLVKIAQVVSETRKASGRAGVAQLSKDLGLTYRSINSILSIVPQINQKGLQGLNQIQKNIAGSEGTVQKQANVVRKTIAFQWDQLLDTIRVAVQKFGKAASPEITRVFDAFAGAGGLIDKATPSLIKFGEAFGRLVGRIGDFVQTKEFATGIKTLVEAVKITLRGVGDAFREFSKAFGGAKEGQSAFVAFADTVRAFATVAANTLPVVARIIGTIVNFLIEHGDAFANFAKITVALVVIRKAYGLLLGPALEAVSAALKFRDALIAASAAEATGALAGALKVLGLRFLFVDKSAKAATASVEAFTAAQAASSASGIAGMLGVGGKAGASTRLTRGAKFAGIVPEAGRLSKVASAFKPLLGVLGRLSIVATAVWAAFEVGKGFISKFTGQLKGITKDGSGAGKGLHYLKVVLDGIGKAFKFVGGILQWFGGVLGTIVGGALKAFLWTIGKIGDAVSWTAGKIHHLWNVIGEKTGLIDDVGLNLTGLSKSIDRVNTSIANVSESLRVRYANSVALAAIKTAESKGIIEGFQSKVNAASRTLVAAGKATSIAATNMERLAGGKGAIQSLFAAVDSGSKTAAAQLKALHKAAALLAQRQLEIRTQNQVIAATESGIPGLASATLVAGQKIVDASSKRTKKSIDAYNESVDAALEAATKKDNGGGGGGGAGGALGTVQTAAEKAAAAVDKLTAAQFRSQASGLINRIASAGPKAYHATAREAALLEKTLPLLDNALEKQREQVQKLDDALQKLQATQLKGTKAFTDAAFAREQEIKKLQLQRLDLIIGGASEEDTLVTTIDEQIAKIQQQAERADLVAALKLDPLKKKLEDTFNPVKELSFTEIMRQFRELTGQRQAASSSLAAGENLRARLDVVSKEAQDKFFAVGQNITLGLAKGAKSEAEQVANTARSTSRGYLKSLNDVFQFGSPSKTTFQRGAWVTLGFANGIKSQLGAVMMSVNELKRILQTATAVMVKNAEMAGAAVMRGFLTGMRTVFGDAATKGTIAYYLHVTIPKRIAELKGPVAYDSTILVPAGEAIMHGLDRGLRTGFGGVESFLKQVAPMISETVPDSLFANQTKQFMVDVAMGKSPDPFEFYKNLVPPELSLGAFSGILDPTLAFLHKSLSLADTTQMAQHLAKLFGTPISSLNTGKHAPNSYHYRGLAADFSNGYQPTAQMDALYAALLPYKGKLFSELLYKTMLGGNHYNHVHAAWMAAAGFDMNSGKIGSSVFDIPGASNIVDQAISAAASKYGVSAGILAAIAKQESGFNPNAKSPDGGYGLFQLTSRDLLRRAGGNPFDPFKNADVGAYFFKTLLNRFGGNTRKALAGYNAGPGAVESGNIPSSTLNTYIPHVMAYFEQFKKLFGGFREHGGPLDPRKWHVVGENGPEILGPGHRGMVYSNAQSQQMMQPSYVDNRQYNLTTNASDPAAILGYIKAHSRDSISPVNLR